MNNQKVISLFGDTIVKFQIWTNQLGLCQFNRYVFNFSDNLLKDMCIIWIFFFLVFNTFSPSQVNRKSKDIEIKNSLPNPSKN